MICVFLIKTVKSILSTPILSLFSIIYIWLALLDKMEKQNGFGILKLEAVIIITAG